MKSNEKAPLCLFPTNTSEIYGLLTAKSKKVTTSEMLLGFG